jgi:peptidoglycan/LPS O-acetylase OafA/YrhL
MTFQNIRLMGIVATVAVLLLIPFIAMKFSDEVKWDGRDFAIAGFLLLGTGLVCELVMRKVKKIRYRLALCAVILAALFVVWAELAVGLIGTRFAGS